MVDACLPNPPRPVAGSRACYQSPAASVGAPRTPRTLRLADLGTELFNWVQWAVNSDLRAGAFSAIGLLQDPRQASCSAAPFVPLSLERGLAMASDTTGGHRYDGRPPARRAQLPPAAASAQTAPGHTLEGGLFGDGPRNLDAVLTHDNWIAYVDCVEVPLGILCAESNTAMADVLISHLVDRPRS